MAAVQNQLRYSIFVTAALGVVGVTASPRGYNSSDLEVETTIGTVKGVVSDEADNVRVFRGIHSAESPTGELRFRPPSPLKKARATKTIDAAEWGPACRQITNTVDNIYSLYFKGFGKPDDVPTAEDCLHVNIWAPRSMNRNESLKPVLICVHGGGHSAGGNSFPYHDGTRLIRGNQNVISVSLNYRLNVFGFPSAAGLDGQQLNPGYMDQRLAIEWTRDNIEAFGGDPTRMLLFGESAGGGSVDSYSYAYAEDPIVQVAPSNFTFIAQKLGWPLDKDEELTCMQSKPWEDIENVINQYNATQNGGRSLSFGPTADGQNVFSDFATRLAAGRVAKVGVLIGNADREGASLAANDLGPAVSETNKPSEQAINAMTNGVFNCPAGLAVWRYRYFGVFPNLDPFTWLGSWHSSILPTLLNTADKYGVANTPTQNEAASFLQSILVNFARDPVHGLSRMGFPQYDPAGNSLVQLVKSPALLSFNASTSYDGAC
ncbi:Alpha/Beta hydrolase protein [Aspergillus aurantiobrunneus]